MDQSNTPNKKIAAIVGLLVIVTVIAIGLVVSNKKDPATNATTTPTPSLAASVSPASSPSPTVEAANTSDYKDGTYSSTGTYDSPGGRESIQVSITLKAGSVTSTSAVSGSTNPTGKQYQGQFIGGYKSMVVGKKIDEVSLSRVSGSSLTSRGFNAALEQIKSQAKA